MRRRKYTAANTVRRSIRRSRAACRTTENSDVDIYIEKGRMRSLIQYFSFINELERQLDCHVDVVTTGIQDKEFLKGIMEEGVLLYEE
ncbi:MAG: nucleotidyltransferase family protein [Agathobacter sp.]